MVRIKCKEGIIYTHFQKVTTKTVSLTIFIKRYLNVKKFVITKVKRIEKQHFEFRKKPEKVKQLDYCILGFPRLAF